MSTRLLALTALGLALASTAYAGSAADALLGAVQPQATHPQVVQGQQDFLGAGGSIRLSDPFLMQFFAAWQAEKQLPYEVNAWAMKIAQHQFTEAAHLWGVVEPKAPETFAHAALAAQLYLLFQLDLPQTFIDQYIGALQSKSFLESRPLMALEQVIGQGFDRWLLDRQVVPSESQATQVLALPQRGLLDTTLKAWASLRTGARAQAILEALPAESAFKIPLAQTLALSHARKNDLSSAAALLKRHVEPALESKRDATALSSHYLQVARLLYQAGSLDGAESFYTRIPKGSPDFFKAHEELTWVWLRKGDVGKLRGELTTLSSRLFNDVFSPEVHLVRAVSNLKLCYYSEVRKDFDAFLSDNKRWAAEITQALKAENTPPPFAAEKDAFTRQAETMLDQRENEAFKLERLGTESITAVLPAVGPQQHWTQARNRVLATIETLKKRRASEYRRQWKNDQVVLTEAIRKMKFVKVELLTQIRALAAQQTDQIRVSSSAPLQAPAAPPEGEMSFVFDGVVWPDELFKLHSVTHGRCLQSPKGT